MARPSEDELIRRYFAPLAGPGGLGLLDDAASLPADPGHDLVLTVDALVAGVHFLPDDPPGSIAWKALAVNLSDLAAKGAEPVGFLLALALPDGWTEPWLDAFAEGLGEASGAGGCPLLGGDTVRTGGPLTISVTALGRVPTGGMVRRTTARPGDLVCVTGTIGDAALGLDASKQARASRRLRDALACRAPQDDAAEPAPESPTWASALSPEEVAFLVERYRRPQPRLAFAPALRDLASAAMDVSDGLAGDLAKLLRVSGVAGGLDLDRIPFSPAARAALAAEPGLRDRLVTGGDDYEILFTLPPELWPEAERRAAALGLPVTAIGAVAAGPGGLAVTARGAPHTLANPSFQHFGAAAP